MIPFPPGGFPKLNEEGTALVTSVLILMVLTVLATAGFWLSHVEMTSGQAYAQSVRALYLAESGIARYFANASGGGADSTAFEYFADGDEWLMTELSMNGPSDGSYAYANAQVTVTSKPILMLGGRTISEVTAEARVQDLRNPDLVTTRAVRTYAEIGGSSLGNLDGFAFGATGGISFDGDKGATYDFQTTAEAGETGSCAPDGSTPIVAVPGTDKFDLYEDKWGDCPYTEACDYDWMEEGAGVDSSYTAGSQIMDAAGINWDDWLSDDFYAGLPNVQVFESSSAGWNAFEAYFHPDKEAEFLAMDSWPITRIKGYELFVNTSIKGFGILIVENYFNVTGGSSVIEWTGLILVGGMFEAYARNEFEVRGGMMTGLKCTDAQRASGCGRARIDNDRTEIKYRPCEINMATSAFMTFSRLDDLFREGSPGG